MRGMCAVCWRTDAVDSVGNIAFCWSEYSFACSRSCILHLWVVWAEETVGR